MRDDTFKDARNLIKYKPSSDAELDEVSSEYKKKIKDDLAFVSELRSRGLTDEDISNNLGVLIDYFEDYNVCKKCKGVENCPKINPGYSLKVNKKDTFVERYYAPCEKVVQRMKLEAHYLVREYPDEWVGKMFPTDINGIEDKDVRGGRGALTKLLLKSSNEDKWFYLTGEFNKGKSYIMACFANYFAEKIGSAVAYIDTAATVDRLRKKSIEDEESFKEEMRNLCTAPLLVLDGFGNEYKTDFAFSTVLFPLLSYRARHKKLTLFTSEFRYSEVESMYVQKVGSARAKQLSMLLLNMCGKAFILTAINEC